MKENAESCSQPIRSLETVRSDRFAYSQTYRAAQCAEP